MKSLQDMDIIGFAIDQPSLNLSFASMLILRLRLQQRRQEQFPALSLLQKEQAMIRR